MAVRDDFSAGEVLAAADLNDTFASKLPYSYGTATPTTTIDGFLWYDENDTPPTPKFWDGAAFQALTSGKILQVVRATDGTDRSTTSTSFADASISVTITPTAATNAILLIWSSVVEAAEGSNNNQSHQITDSSNNPISGAEAVRIGNNSTAKQFNSAILVGYATPATTSAVTYKGRFRIDSATTANLRNSQGTGQLYAIEVGA